jgi:hypothetical protein
MIVTVQSALSEVQASARRLRDAARELVLFAVEDWPRRGEVHLVTLVHDAALDLAAEAEHAGAALRLDSQPMDVSLAQAPQAVIDCQAHVNLMGAALVRELATPGRLNDLAVFGRDRGRDAAEWAEEIVRCIESCQQLLWTDMQLALLGYWRELADTAIRTVRPAANAELEREGRSHDA